MAVVALAGVALLVWQPDVFKKDVLQYVAKEISRSSPYDLTVGHVSGNIFTGISLQNIRLLAKSDHSDVLQAKAVKIGISWLALLHRTIRVSRLDWTDPTVRLLINQEGHLVSPLGAGSSSSQPFPFTYSIKDFSIDGGHIIVTNHSVTPATELDFRDITLKARVTTQEVAIDQLHLRLEEGDASIAGRVALRPALSGQWTMDDHALSLNKILSAAGAPPLPLILTHSGHWKIQTSSQTVQLDMKGNLAGAPIALSGVWSPTGIQRAELAWDKPGLAAAAVHLSEGKGTFKVDFSSAEFKAAAQGNVNLPRRSIEGKGTAEKVAWQGKRLDKIDFTFSVDPRHQQLDATAQNLQLQAPCRKSI